MLIESNQSHAIAYRRIALRDELCTMDDAREKDNGDFSSSLNLAVRPIRPACRISKAHLRVMVNAKEAFPSN